MSSFYIRNWERESTANDFDEGDIFWNPKDDSFEIYGQSKLEEKLTDIHLNPVRSGIVQKPEDYCWSSTRWYAHHRTAWCSHPLGHIT